MTDFITAMMDWNKSKEKFVASQLSTAKEKLAPRKNLYVTIPEKFETEIKEFIKAKRQEADDAQSLISARRKVELALEFEKDNPPPRRAF